MRPIIRRCVAALVALVALCALTAPAFAEEGGAVFDIRPARYDPQRPITQSYFVYDAALGMQIDDEVLVRNSGDQAGTVRLYPLDAATGETSGTVYGSADAPRDGVGAWIQLAAQELTLQPGEVRRISFTLRVPADAPAGHHVGGFAAENTALTRGSGRGAIRVNFQTRSVIAVQINLPGPAVERVAVTGITTGRDQGYQRLIVGLRNDGTEMVKPIGTLVVTDAAGHEVQRIALKLNTVLPRAEIQYPVLVERQALGAGAYRATVHLDYGKGGATDYRGEFTVTQEQVAQVFQGAQPLAPPPGAAAPAPQATTALSPFRRVWPGVAGALLAALLGATLLLSWRRRAATRRG